MEYPSRNPYHDTTGSSTSYRDSILADSRSMDTADSRSMATADHVDKHVSTPTEEYAARQENWSADTHTQVEESQAENGQGQLHVQALRKRQNVRSDQASTQMVFEVFEWTTGTLEILERLEYPEQFEREQIPFSPEAQKMLDNWTKGGEAISVKGTVHQANVNLVLMRAQVISCNPAIRDQVKTELKKRLALWQETGLELKSNVSKELIKQLFLVLDGNKPEQIVPPDSQPLVFDDTGDTASLSKTMSNVFGTYQRGAQKTDQVERSFREDPNKKARKPNLRKNTQYYDFK
ncbi:uncharacterized protein LOC135822457 [Sycon ciliatum]|uniref:uncharacterized protein LOC135822457 n=1 Tax=Sycon ciliatum TaxID=27933 RepID=UPI0031F62B6B